MKKSISNAGCGSVVQKLKGIKAKIDNEQVTKGYGATLGVGLNAISNADIGKWESDRHVIDDYIEAMRRNEQLQNKEDANRKKHSELERLAVLAGIEKAAEKEARAKVKKMAVSRLNRVNKNK
ncbi:hypothetical protein ACMXYR_02785 [Neptuniibacter sp. QD29_5]|uniref:hypothetical protein n=1 Tax=Neptuniibacter sp. QD29_5 TaxID=3398207 RepID=UPI0039F5B51D